MATIIIDDAYTKYTNGDSKITAPSACIKDALQYVFGNYPQFMVYVLEQGVNTGLLVLLNDEEILEAADIHRDLSVEDTLYLFNGVPEGNYAAVVEFMVDALAAMETLSSLSVSTLYGIAYVGAGMLMLGGMIALNVIMGALTDSIAEPSINSGSLNNSATYTFNGITNTTASGTALQLVYGKVRTGGHIISLFTDTTSTPTTYGIFTTESDANILNYQIALCEGEIEKVSDVYVNKMPVTFYDAVYTYPAVADYLRKGTATQTIMPDFSKISNTTSINRKVINASSTITAAEDVGTVSYSPVYGVVSLTPPYQLTQGPYKLVWAEEF